MFSSAGETNASGRSSFPPRGRWLALLVLVFGVALACSAQQASAERVAVNSDAVFQASGESAQYLDLLVRYDLAKLADYATKLP